MNAAGKLYGIGVGPGDPELLTRKAARILEEVDWIFLPAGTSGGPGIAGKIIESLNLGNDRLRPVTLSMSRDRNADLHAYASAAQEIMTELCRGRSAAWVTEGDPLFYSTFLHVWAAVRALAPDVAIEIVPGITSMGAAAARMQIPIASLDETVAVVPAAYGLHHLDALLENFSTVVLLKVHGVFDQLQGKLASLSRPPQTYYIEKVGSPDERMVRDLTSLQGAKIPYFSLVILRNPLPNDNS